MREGPKGPPALRWRSLWVALAAATVLAVLVAHRESRGRRGFSTSSWDPSDTLVVTAAPQDRAVFLTWSPVAAASYVVRWRVKRASEWKAIAVGQSARRALSGLHNGVPYEFRIEARLAGGIATSAVVTAIPRARPNCASLDYLAGPPRVSFFCTQAALDAYLQQRGIDPQSLRCRQRPVAAWMDEAPDCHYVAPNNDQLLLLRSADAAFTGAGGYPPAAVVRQHARQAIWGSVSPFDAQGRTTPPMRPLPGPLVGSVTKYASAQSFAITSSPNVSSVVTWFKPERAAAGRFSIYHEGHGGSGVEIGAQTIDWLLDRGWQVIAVDMPLVGANRGVMGPAFSTHDRFESTDDGSVSPIESFLLPVKSVVDAVVRESGTVRPEVLLIGRSGGGWTSYVYGAVDSRVDIVVSVAGGLPLSARMDAPTGPAELGDYEQTAPHLYDVVGHEHLMLAAGSRGAFYVFNRWDTCCFRAGPNDPFVRYLRTGARALDKPIGVFVDQDNHGHSLGTHAYDALERYLRSVTGR